MRLPYESKSAFPVASHRTLNATNLGGRDRYGETLHAPQRRLESSRIQHENQYLLHRIQSKQSTYNVWSWENERKEQIKRIKQICHYPPSISKTRKYTKKSRKKGAVLLDMEKRYASAGPNKKMYDLYNLSINNAFYEPDGQMASDYVGLP